MEYAGFYLRVVEHERRPKPEPAYASPCPDCGAPSVVLGRCYRCNPVLPRHTPGLVPPA